MFKKKKDNTPKMILAVLGAIATVGGLVFGLTKLKKRNKLECQCEDTNCYYDDEEECCCHKEEIESIDEDDVNSEMMFLLSEEEIEALTK